MILFLVLLIFRPTRRTCWSRPRRGDVISLAEERTVVAGVRKLYATVAEAFDAVEYRLDPRCCCTVWIVILDLGDALVALFLLYVVPWAGETTQATTARCVYCVTIAACLSVVYQ